MPTYLKRAAVLASVMSLVSGAGLVIATETAHAGTVATPYAFQANAFGTRVRSNNVALSVGPTALAWIGCTKLAGINPSNRDNAGNHLAEAGAPEDNPWFEVGAVTSRTRTFQNLDRRLYGVEAKNTISTVTLSGPAPSDGATAPVLRLEGLTTKATAQSRRGVLSATSVATSSDIDLVLDESVMPVEGTPLADLVEAVDEGFGAVADLLQQTSGQAIEVPGLGVLRLGPERTRVTTRYASANAYTMLVQLAGADGKVGTFDDSTVQIGRSGARISKNLPAGIMHGYGHALDVSAADGVLSLGRVGTQLLPCAGTDGKVRGLELPAHDLLGGVFELGTVRGLAYGLQNRDRSGHAWTKGSLAELALGTGEHRIVVRGVAAVAEVRKTSSGKLRRSTQGTGVGSITVGGEEITPPAGGEPVELPGIGKLEFTLKEKLRRGVAVTALRITLDPGQASETIINVGNARTFIRPS